MCGGHIIHKSCFAPTLSYRHQHHRTTLMWVSLVRQSGSTPLTGNQLSGRADMQNECTTKVFSKTQATPGIRRWANTHEDDISPKYNTLRIRTIDACADKMRKQWGTLGTLLATVLGHWIYPETLAAGCERLITHFRRGKILCHWNLWSAANWARSSAPLKTKLNSTIFIIPSWT